MGAFHNPEEERRGAAHSAIHYGILGALLAKIRPADLNLIDATWINANPNDGPWTSYAAASRKDRLVASVDPVAADIWAVKNILIPGFHENGYSPPWPYPSADPDDPTSEFRQYIDHSMDPLLDAGHEVTNDLSQVDEIKSAPPGEVSDPRGGSAATATSRLSFESSRPTNRIHCFMTGPP